MRMKKNIALVLVLIMVLGLIGSAQAEPTKLTAQQADMQINYLFSNFKTFQQDETNRTWQYAVTDLNHDGQLELIAASLNTADHTTDVKLWEMNLKDSTFREGKITVPQNDTFPDIIAENADTYYDKDTDTWSYMFYDNVVLSQDDVYSVKTSVTYKEERLNFTRLAIQHTMNLNGYISTTYTDFDGRTITPEAYNSAGANAYATLEKSSTNFDWFRFADVSNVSRLADSYSVFDGEKQPDKTTPAPTPVPTSGPQPPRPTYLTITKNPTNETHVAGETAWFVADANAYDSLTWTFISPNGGQYSWSSFSNIFPYASVGGSGSTTLSISNVAQDMNNWSVACTFYYNGQTARTNSAYLYVRQSPKPTPTPVPYGGMITGSVTDFAMSTVSLYLNNGTSVSIPREICDCQGDYYIGASADVYYNGSAPTRQSIYRVVVYGKQPLGPIYGSANGTIYACAMHTFMIHFTEGEDVQVSREVANVVYGDMTEGCSCTAYYQNYPSSENIYRVDIYGTEPIPDPEPDPGPPPEPTGGTMGGSIYACAMNTFMIHLDNGTDVQADREVANVVYGDMTEGSPCTVYYSGSSPTRDTIYQVDIYGSTTPVEPEEETHATGFLGLPDTNTPEDDWTDYSDWSDYFDASDFSDFTEDSLTDEEWAALLELFSDDSSDY